jgi:2-aminoadipate transaminase
MATDARAGARPGNPGVAQREWRPGIVELGPGYLDPALLPTRLMRVCGKEALERWGPPVLGYGAEPGPREFRSHLAARVRDFGGDCGATNVLTTGGTSAALGHLAAMLARQGRTVLTEATTYDLGRGIFDGYGVPTVPVPGPPDELDVSELRRLARRAARSSGRPPALYLVPTFHNPTGRVLSTPRRREVLAVAQEEDLLVIEDQAYAELSYRPDPLPPPLWCLAEEPERVVTLFTFAKTLAPGLRVGWLVSGQRRVAELAADPVRVSGGGPNHYAVTAVAAACLGGHYDRHLTALRQRLAERRDALRAALHGRLPDGFGLGASDGGFFVWVTLPPSVDDARLLCEAEARGVSFVPGRRFGPAAAGVRLCFAAHGASDLVRGAERFLAACRAVLS